MNARSTWSSMSFTEACVRIDLITGVPGLTGYTGPAKPEVTRLAKRRPPIDSGLRLAPITAIERG